MRVSSFPGCCRSRVIHSFSGGHRYEKCYATRIGILKEVIRVIEGFIDTSVSVIFAAPTSTQKVVIKALQDIGFYHN